MCGANCNQSSNPNCGESAGCTVACITRRTVVGRVSKSEYVLFLAKHHLWGTTGAKFTYGLFAIDGKAEQEDLVAAALFWSEQTKSRADCPF
jgi:hypothetical protein